MSAHWVAKALVAAAGIVALGSSSLAAQRGAPGSVTVGAANGAVTVSWTGIKDPDIVYRVVRGPDPRTPGDDLTNPLAFDVTSFVDATGAPGITYFYAVIAVYPDGSQRASVPTQFLVPNNAPTVTKAVNPAPLTAAPPLVTVQAPVASTRQVAVAPAAPTVATQRTRPAPTGIIPPVANPTGFVASQGRQGIVSLTWQPVPGAAFYQLWGSGLPNTGIQVSAVPAPGQVQISQNVTGLPAPGMHAWMVGAYFLPGPVSTAASAFTTTALWLVSSTAGPVPPNLVSPTLPITQVDRDYGAYNDSKGRQIGTTFIPSGPVPGTIQACPITPMFYYDGARPPVPAAPWDTLAGNAGPLVKYPIVNGGVHFRAPIIPGLPVVAPTPAPSGSGSAPYNAWVYLTNCRGEYSKALPFRIYSTALAITAASPPAGVIAGQTMQVSGTGLAGVPDSASQKVMFHFEFLTKTPPSSGGGSNRKRFVDVPAPVVGYPDERGLSVSVPSTDLLPVAASQVTVGNQVITIPAHVGFWPTAWRLLAVDVYVLRNGQRTASVPIRYCTTTVRIATPGYCWF